MITNRSPGGTFHKERTAVDVDISNGQSGETTAAPRESDCSQRIEFSFVQYVACRRLRGAPAVKMLASDDGGETGLLLWMSRDDILANIRDFGDSKELQKALQCYE